jgi:hypothetical protein
MAKAKSSGSGFGSVVDTKATSAASKKKDYEKVGFNGTSAVDGVNLFDKVSALKQAKAMLENELKVFEDELKEQIRSKFAEIGMRDGAKPESIEGHGDIATARCDCRRSVSTLDQGTVSDLEAMGIDVECKETVAFKKSVLDNEETVQTIIGILEEHGRFNVGDLLDRTVKYTAGERTLDDLFRKVSDPVVVGRYLEKVSTIAIANPSLGDDPTASKFAICDIVNKSGIFR